MNTSEGYRVGDTVTGKFHSFEGKYAGGLEGTGTVVSADADSGSYEVVPDDDEGIEFNVTIVYGDTMELVRRAGS